MSHHMHHDHSSKGMDHGGGMDMPHKCSMNMLWNTQIIDTCIVFRGWHVSSNFVFFLSFLAIVGLGVLYEWLREVQKRYDIAVARRLRASQPSLSGHSTPSREEESLLSSRPRKMCALIPTLPRILRASLYGVSVCLSFFLMLIFMTYNAYLILAVVLGAAVGHFIFGTTMDVDAVLAGQVATKGAACH